jgi:competence protein ComGF
MSSSLTTHNNKFFGIVYQRFNGVSKIILEDLSVFERTELTYEYTFFDYFESQFAKTSLYQEKRNILLVHVDGNIIQFEKLIFDDETRNMLNQQGLDIYIYEVSLFYQGPEAKKLYINLDIEDNNIDYEFPSTPKNLDNLRCFEFDSINALIDNNNLTNVTCYVTDYNNSKYAQRHYPKFKIYTKNFFLPTLVGETTDSFGYNETWTNYFSSTVIKKKFISLAWRYTNYRQIVQTFLCFRNASCSWAYSLPIEKCETYFDITQWQNTNPDIWQALKEGNKYIENNSPLVVDLTFDITEVYRGRNSIPNYEFDNLHFCPMGLDIPIEKYAEAFCSVISESEFFRPSAVVGEKTVNAIKSGRPFILVAGPHSLEYLQKLGFKTFSDFWDESYDQIEDHEQRLLAVLKLIEDLDKLSLEQMQNLYNQMKPIIEHNFYQVANLGTMQIVN